MFRRLVAFDQQLVVYTFDPRQTFHGVAGQGLVGRLGDRAGQRDHAVFGLCLYGIVL